MTSALADAEQAHLPARSGGLLWAFHEGFAAYVSRLADGRVDVADGASLLPDGRVLFPFAPASEGRPDFYAGAGLDAGPGPGIAQELRCRGSVHYTGHRGLLAVTLADPAIVAGSGTAVLTIADPFTPGERLVFADLGATVPRLTEEGADLFLGHYREGTPLAPLEILPSTGPSTGRADPTPPTDRADQDARDD